MQTELSKNYFITVYSFYRQQRRLSLLKLDIRGVPPFMDSAVLLSWHGSLLTDFSSFREAIAQLTAWHWAEGRKTERCPLTIHISLLLIIMRLYWRVIINSTVSNNEVSIHWNNSYRPKALGDLLLFLYDFSVNWYQQHSNELAARIPNMTCSFQMSGLHTHPHTKVH